MKKILILIRGLPGSGKSTLAETYKTNGRYAHYEADMYFIGADGVYRFDPKKIGAAHNWCQARVMEAMTRQDNIIVSNTFTQKWEMEKYLKLAEQFNYDVVVKTCKGEYQNIHGVPAEHIERMRARWEE